MSARHFIVGFLLLALVLAASSARLQAQVNPCLTRTVPVNVTTNDYRVVSGLTSANFRGKYRGQPVDIISVKYDTGPRRVVIVLDASTSMQYAWEAEIATAQNLVFQSPPKDTFAVLSFAEGPNFRRIEFGQDRHAVINGLASLAGMDQPHSKTAILDALVEAVNMLPPQSTGNAVLLISDGLDNASRSRPRGVESTIITSGVRLFALIIPDPLIPRWTAMEEDRARDLPKTIQAVGGDSLTLAHNEAVPSQFALDFRKLTEQDRKNMASAASALGREISEFYAVEVKLPEAVDKPRDWQLEVVGDIPEKQHLRVVYPHRLAPCQ